jgi:hypothetical protein
MSEQIETTRPFTAASYNLFLSEDRLMASRCTACGTRSLPPRAICPTCHGTVLEWVETSGNGRLAGFTVIYIGPSFMIAEGYGREKPYVSGIVTLEEGVMISARITGVDAAQPETIQVGMPLRVEFLHAGEAENAKTHLAFKPV